MKNPAAASFSLLLGLVIITAIALSLRINDHDRLAQKAEPIAETTPVDPKLSETQRALQIDREQKLGKTIPAEEKTITETKPLQTTTVVPTPKAATPAPIENKPDRTTKTS